MTRGGYAFQRLTGSPLPAYRVTGGGLPPRGVTAVRGRRAWAVTWSAHPGPRGTRHAFGETLPAALAAAGGSDPVTPWPGVLGNVPGEDPGPCPDCGQGWPDGCAEDCPSRDE
jgi:hypothetical protein